LQVEGKTTSAKNPYGLNRKQRENGNGQHTKKVVNAYFCTFFLQNCEQIDAVA